MSLVVFLLLLFVFAYVLIVNYIGPMSILKPKQKNFLIDGKVVTSPKELGLEYEDVQIKSFDGVDLKGWLVKSIGDPVGNVIYIHGTYTNKAFGLKRQNF
jgi:hypothetical protein